MANFYCKPFYYTVEDFYSEPVSDSALYDVLQPALTANFFTYIYVPVEQLDQDGNVVKTYENIGINYSDLVNEFYACYCNRFLGFKAKSDSATEKLRVKKMIKDTVKSVLSLNQYKYLKLIETLGFKYDPIANYDMNETSGTWASDGNTKSTTTPSGEVISKDYRTQYDDTSEGDANLESYNKTSYNNAKTETVIEHQDLGKTISANKDIYEIGTSDIDNFSGSKIRRNGNIGVTTTQQMIESQRQLVRFSIIQEYFNDLDKAILLNVYDI